MTQQSQDEHFEVTLSECLSAEKDKDAIFEVEEVKTSEKGAVHTFEVTSEERFQNWLRALKARYWVDFGNQDAYNVEWLRKTDGTGDVCELAVQLFQVSSNEKPKLLFCMTVYINKRKFMVQGNFKDLWKDNEFVKLRSFVDVLCVNNDLTNSQINKLYAEIFNCENLQLFENVNLNALVDSDGEDENVVEKLNDSSDVPSKGKKRVVKSPTRKIVPRSKFSSMGKPETTSMKNLSEEQLIRKLMDRIEELESKLSSVEDVTAKLENNISDIELQQVQANKCIRSEFSSFRNEVMSDMQARGKSESSAFTNLLEGLRHEVDVSLSSCGNDLEKFQGRLGSLIEEKSKLEKKTRSLEDQLEKLKEENVLLNKKVISLEEKVMDNSAAMMTPASQCEGNSNNSGLERNNEIGVPSSRREVVLGNPVLLENNNETRVNRKDVPNVGANFDFVFLCDSNRKFIDMKKLCPGSTYKLISCGNLDKATEILKTPRFVINKGLIIHTGVNDLEHFEVEEILEKQTEVIQVATAAFPGKKIILSGLTPRRDELNSLVTVVNNALFRKFKDTQNLSFVNNDNLNDDQFLFDKKHLNKMRGVPVFARNLKIEIRTACGDSFRKQITPNTKRSTNRREVIRRDGENMHNLVQDQHSQQVGYSSIPEMKTFSSQLSDLTGMLKTFIQSVSHNNSFNHNQINQQRIVSHPVPNYQANYTPIQHMFAQPVDVPLRSR